MTKKSTQDSVKEVLPHLKKNDLFHYSDLKNLVGSDDKATRIIKYLLSKGLIIKIPHEKYKDYKIDERDKRKKWYIFKDATFAEREWEVIHGKLNDVLSQKKVEQQTSSKNETGQLTEEGLSLLFLIAEEIDLNQKRYAHFRTGEDIRLLMNIYKAIDSTSNPIEKYRVKSILLSFLIECFRHGIVGRIPEDVESDLYTIIEDEIPAMPEFSGNNALNIPSPMMVSFLAFQAYATISKKDLINVIRDVYKEYRDKLNGIQERDKYKKGVIALDIFSHMLERYYVDYPDRFTLEPRDEFALELLEDILNENDNDKRARLHEIRRKLMAPEINVKKKDLP